MLPHELILIDIVYDTGVVMKHCLYLLSLCIFIVLFL